MARVKLSILEIYPTVNYEVSRRYGGSFLYGKNFEKFVNLIELVYFF